MADPMQDDTRRSIYIAWGLSLAMLALSWIFGGPYWGVPLLFVGIILVLHGHFPKLFASGRIKSACALILAVVAIGAIYLSPFGDRWRPRKSPPILSPVASSPPSNSTPTIKRQPKKLVAIKDPTDNACSPKGGGRYAEDKDIPGGPTLQRPMIIVEKGTFHFVITTLNGNTVFLFQTVLVNRGEASIVKDWRLCLVGDDGKPSTYEPAEIPEAGIPVDGATIMPTDDLIDAAMKTQIQHGSTQGGWVAFKIPGLELDQAIGTKRKKILIGAISYQDYLSHTYSRNLAYSLDVSPAVGNSPPADLYIPGAKPQTVDKR